MSKAEQSGEDLHCVMLAYRVTPRGPGKLSPAEVMTQHKLRALLSIKEHLSVQLTTGRESMLQQKQQQSSKATQHNSSKKSNNTYKFQYN